MLRKVENNAIDRTDLNAKLSRLILAIIAGIADGIRNWRGFNDSTNRAISLAQRAGYAFISDSEHMVPRCI